MLRIIIAIVISLTPVAPIFAQCTEWVGPDPNSGYDVFDGAPCAGESQTFGLFEVWQAEAYELPEIQQGGSYQFGICGNLLSWQPDFTIIAPSGTIDAFGFDSPDTCSISFTASESGTYLAVINKTGEDNCGIQLQINNGFPVFTTIASTADCEPQPIFVDGAQSFESSTLPPCWVNLDVDGDSLDWELLQGNDSGFDGDWVIGSRSYLYSALTPDNYLITPQLSIGVSDSLYYVVRTVDAQFPSEHYGIFVSTTGIAPSDFSDLVFEEVLSNTAFKGRAVDLGAYANQDIYIAFRHYDSSGQNLLVIDAVALPGIVNCDPLAISQQNGHEDSFIVYPNPARGSFNVLNANQDAAVLLELFDMQGRLVKVEKAMLNLGQSHPFIIPSEAKGVYLLRILSENGIAKKRIVIE